MKKDLLDLLVCPLTKEPLKLIEFETVVEKYPSGKVQTRVYTGILISEKSQIAYPIIDGIPRLFKGALYFYEPNLENYTKELSELNINEKSRCVDENFKKFFLPTLKSFGHEWTEHELKGKTWGLSQPERLNKYLEYMNIPNQDYSNRLFLDVGAGSGQFTCTIAESLNCDIIGIDLAIGIKKGEFLRRTIKNGANINFIQANLMELPFNPRTFDYVHASGVLHHTPNTYNAFINVEKFTKPGGKFGVWLYKEQESYLPLLPFIKTHKLAISREKARKYTTKWDPKFLYMIIYLYTFYFQFFYKLNSIIRKKNHDQTQKEWVTSLFDALAPTYVFMHTPEEVNKWFIDNNYLTLVETDKDNVNGFNICGIKSKS